MAVETNRIGSNVGIMNHFKYYNSYVTGGITSRMTNELAYAIYLKCGKSYTSTAAKYCPPQSYINNNFWVNYEDNRSTVNVKVNIGGTHTDNNLIKLSDLTYTVTIDSHSVGEIRADVANTTYYIGYSNFYRNKPTNMGVTATSSFTADTDFIHYSYSVTGDGVSTTSATVNPRYPSILSVSTFKNTVSYTTSQIHVWDTINPRAEATTNVNYYVRPVSQISFRTDCPTYVLYSGSSRNFPVNAYGSIVSGVNTNINSTPIPQNYYFQQTIYNVNNYNGTQLNSFSTENIFNAGIVTSTTYGSSSKKSFITTTVPLVFIGGSVTSLYHRFNYPNVPNYIKIFAYAENYNNSVVTASFNTYLIENVTSCNFVDTTAPAILLYDYPNSIDIGCHGTSDIAEIFLKSFSMTSTLNMTTLDTSVDLGTYDDTPSTIISYNMRPNVIGTGNISFTGVKYDNTTITASKSISSVYSNYDWFYLAQYGWVQSVYNNYVIYDVGMFNSTEVPNSLHISNQTTDEMFRIEIIYEDEIGSGEKSANITARYEKVDTHRFKLTFEPDTITQNQTTDHIMEYSFGNDVRIKGIKLYNSLLDEMLVELNEDNMNDTADILVAGFYGGSGVAIYWLMTIDLTIEKSVDMPFRDRDIDWFDLLNLHIIMEPYH